MVWKEGLLIKLHKMGITGALYTWIQNCVFHRSVQVRLGMAFEDKSKVDNGILQGSAIRQILFLIKRNGIFSRVDANAIVIFWMSLKGKECEIDA